MTTSTLRTGRAASAAARPAAPEPSTTTSTSRSHVGAGAARRGGSISGTVAARDDQRRVSGRCAVTRPSATACRSRSSARPTAGAVGDVGGHGRPRRCRPATSAAAWPGVIIFMYLQTAARLTGSKSTSGLALRELVEHAGLGGDEHVRRRGVAGGGRPCRSSTGSCVRASGTTPAPTRYSALVAHPHSGWMNSSASGASATRALRSAPLMPACTWHSPSQMCMFSRPVMALHVGPEELVGAEQHLGVGGDRLHHLDGVRRGAADVGLGLHRRRGVDVAHDDGAGVLGLPRPELCRR